MAKFDEKFLTGMRDYQNRESMLVVRGSKYLNSPKIELKTISNPII